MQEQPCPACKKPMMNGFLVAESFLQGAKWMQERTRLALGGETLVQPDGFGNVYIPGLRCPSCKVLILKY